MTLLVRGGTVVTAERSFRADVLCEGGTIAQIGPDLAAPTGAEAVDAGGLLVMPSRIPSFSLTKVWTRFGSPW